MIRNFTLFFVLIIFVHCKKDDEPSDFDPLQDFQLVEPLNNSEEQETLTNFKWRSSSKLASYKLQISLNEDGSTPFFEEDNIQDTIFSIQEALFSSSTFYWTVTAIHKENGSELGTNNGYFSFTTKFEEPQPSPEKTKYYVSPYGIDNGASGTKEQPFKTIAFAAQFIPENESDTLFIMAGEYLENSPIIIPTGVNLIGESKESVLIRSNGFDVPGIINDEQFKKVSRSALIQLSSSSIVDGNQEVAHFTLDGKNKSLKSGIWFENRSNVSLHNVSVKYTDLRGVVVATSSKMWYTEPTKYLTGVKIYNCDFRNCGKDLNSETLGNLHLGQLDGAEIHDITIEDDEGYGIKFMWDGYFKNSSFYNIKTILNETDKLWGEDIGIELWNLGPGNEIYNVESNTWLSLVNHPNIFGVQGEKLNLSLHHVKIIDTDGKSSKEGFEIGVPHAEISDCYIENKGMSIAVWNMGRENIVIRNNIFSNSKYQINWAGGAGVYIDNSTDWSYKNIRIYNNIFDRHVNAVRIKGINLIDFYIKNNLFLNSRDNDVLVDGGTIEFAYNYLYTSNSETWRLDGEMSINNNFEGNAEILQTGEKWGDFYKPASENSPLINSGINIGTPFSGSAPDIGFYELEK